MSIDLDIFRKAGIETEKDARAQRAVKAFRALQPTLSAYARILTKNSHVIVEMAARDNGSTDGKKIFFRPPIALGDDVPHQRRLCDKRDENKQLLCLACATREGVLTTIYHEIAHICFDSFEKTSDRDRAELVGLAVREVNGKYAEAIAKKIESTPSWHKESYIAMASLISEFLPVIVNALEDARVNRELFKARKGTKVMFDADITRVFNEGVEQKDDAGKIIIKKWNEYPLNLQAIVGLFCKASGYDYTDWFVSEVISALDDTDLTVLVNKIDTVYSAADVYHLSFPVLARLRELGFCKLKEDPKVEGETDASEEDEASDQDGDSESDDSATPSDDASSGTKGSDNSEVESSDNGGEGESESGNANSNTGTGGTEEGDDSTKASGSAGDDQSDGSDDNSDPESSMGDGSEDEKQADEQGESTGEEGSSGDSSDQSVDDSGKSDNDTGASGRESESSGEDQGSSGGEGDLDEDSKGTPKGDSESDVSETSSGDETSSDSTDEARDFDSDSSIRSGDASESVDSDDHLESASPADDVSTDQEAGTKDVDLADSEDREKGSINTGDDLGGVQDLPEKKEELENEVIDTGADDGTGGTELIENKENDRLPMGTPEECKFGLLKWGDHEEKPKSVDEGKADNAVDRAIIQGLYFETPSRYIYGVRLHHYGEPIWTDGYNMSIGWDSSRRRALGIGFHGNFVPTEKILGPALLRMRVAFADNQRGKEIRSMKSGKVDARVLGKRAHHGDDRLFKRKTLPGKKNYFVVIGVDISGSTMGTNIILEKQAVMAQAQLLARVGIPFAIYAHSGNLHAPHSGRSEGMDLDIYLIKEEHEVWDSKTKERLENIGPDSANLDGHAMEFLRKKLDQSSATDKIIMYYSDGKMPAENHDEELEILQRELKLCKRKGYTVMGVGIRTDSPARHGLDTVQVDTDEDVAKVVKHLEKRLLIR